MYTQLSGYTQVSGYTQMGGHTQMGAYSPAFMSSMNRYSSASALSYGNGAMSAFTGVPMPGNAFTPMNDPTIAGIFGQVGKNKAAMDKKCKSALMGNFLGRALGLVGGAALAVAGIALTVGTGGIGSPLGIALIAAGAGVGLNAGGSLGFLLGGGGDLMGNQANSYAQFMR